MTVVGAPQDLQEGHQDSSQTKVPADYAAAPNANSKALSAAADGSVRKREIGGREGPEPTRFGDWEKSGRCIDF